jgi:hypothetical protein
MLVAYVSAAVLIAFWIGYYFGYLRAKIGHAYLSCGPELCGRCDDALARAYLPVGLSRSIAEPEPETFDFPEARRKEKGDEK